jgi:hypothetical protein
MRAETALDRGSVWWFGAGAGACFRLGPLCGGPLIRVRASDGARDVSPRAPVRLRSFEMALALEAPVALGPLRLLPGVSLGAGQMTGRWHAGSLTSVTHERDRDRDWSRDDRFGRDMRQGRRSGRAGDAQVPGPVDDQPFARTGLRAGASLGIALPIGGGAAIELSLGIGARPALRAGGAALAPADLVGHAGAGLGLRYGRL